MEQQTEKHGRLIAYATTLPPTPTAIIHPCDQSTLSAVVEATQLGLISPILVGPCAKMQAIAERYALDLSGITMVDTPHSHAAAERAVQLVHEGRAQALMKGSLHTDELMAAVVARDSGLRTERRISHCFVMDVPGRVEPLIITDAAVNIRPTLEDKMHIVQNAIDLAAALRFKDIFVALLCAVETVTSKMPATLEAATLCKTAERRQIVGAVLDGPLALDNAIDLEAACQLARVRSVSIQVCCHG